MRIHLIFASFVALTPCVIAAPTTSANCYLPGVGTASGDRSCSVGVGFAAAARIDQSSTVPTDPSQYTSVSFQASASSGFGPYPYGAGYASASYNASYTFTTLGDVRPGYIEVMADSYGYQMTDAPADFNVQLSGVPGIPGYVGANSAQIYTPGVAHFGSPFATTLGLAFTLSASAMASADQFGTGLAAEPTTSDLSETFSFRFFEADGVTPVAVAETPEPAAWAMLAAGLAVVGGAKRLRYARR